MDYKGATICFVSAPWCGGAPANTMFGHKLLWPCRHHSQSEHGVAGSNATKSPAAMPLLGMSAAARAATSCPGTNGAEIVSEPMPPSL